MIAFLAAAVVVALVGFRLGSGDVLGAAVTAVGGGPLGLVLLLGLPPREPAVREVHALPGTDRAELLRLAAALYCGEDSVGRALAAAAPGPLPGVSDRDGTPATGLRGIVSELVVSEQGEETVVAHAVLCGPAGWAAGHGVAEPDGLPAQAIVVAWDGVVRGAVEVAPTTR